jgi:glycosyl transferase, family 25
MRATPAGQKLLDRFERVRVINLASRRDRLRDVTAQLARLGLAPGDGRVERFDACRFDEPGAFPTRGTRGCFHSHLEVVREAARGGVASLLIVEDDLDFAADIEVRLAQALQALDGSDWSFFYGAVLNDDPCADEQRPLSRAAPTEAMLGAHFLGIAGHVLAPLERYLTAMAERPAGSPQGGPMHVDGAYSWFRRDHPALQTFVACPVLGTQRSSRTDVHALSWKDTVPLVRDTTAIGRRLARSARSAFQR